MVSERTSQSAFFGTLALLFAGSAVLTIAWCRSMQAMGKMPMPGGWSMSMTWTRMPEQTWIEAELSFLVMWIVMMAAMMLPSFVPMLSRYRRAVGRAADPQLAGLSTLVCLGYFSVWTIFGLIVFPLGGALAIAEMNNLALARAVPIAVGVAITLAGAFQFTTWKAHYLACCRGELFNSDTLAADQRTAWLTGLRFGLHCSYSCLNLTGILLVVGLMDLRAMGVITTAITLERLGPAGERITRVIGMVAVGVGLFSITRAAGFC